MLRTSAAVASSQGAPAATGRPITGDPHSDALLRGTVALGLIGVALIHFLDLFAKFDETPYLGFLYLGLILACLVVAFTLMRTQSTALWALAGGLAGATFLAYTISRTVGLPSATDDIGNWTESLGLASLFIEGVVVVLSGYALALSGPVSQPGPRSVALDR